MYRLFQIALALYFSREYAAAAEAARQAIRSYPDLYTSYLVLAAALGQMGENAEAKEVLEKAIAIAPAASIGMSACLRPEDRAHMLEGLRKAGMPEE